jgi:predicted enzyme related to lactoylglutathione lyase
VELQSTAPTDDLTWLHDVFGFTSRTVDMASGPYHLLESDGATRGGVTPSRSGHSAFVAWIHVEALDDTLTKVRTAGGTVISEVFADPEVGQMVMVADPSGAAFGLVQPA